VKKLLILLIVLISGCYTDYYESGRVKSEGFTLGTQGGDRFSVINVESKEE
jgi:hypothetical protein